MIKASNSVSKNDDILGKIILKEKILGLGELVIRYPQKKDARKMVDYINTLSKEGTFVTFQGEEMTLESEKKFLETELEKIKENKSVMLLAFVDNNLIGITGIQCKDKVASHEGILGISITQLHRGKGIGKKMLSSILEESKKINQLRIITLQVFANNSVARKLYASFGFQEFGRLPDGIFYKGDYVDELYMYKSVVTK